MRPDNHIDPDRIRHRAQRLGLCSTLLGIGLGRFAFTPLMPSMIEAGWMSPAEAARIGAANFLGYLAGAALAVLLARRSLRGDLGGAAILTAVSLAACAAPLGETWFLGWRFLAGLTGAWLMIRGVSRALRMVPLAQRPRVSGVAFTGIGIGTVLTGIAAWIPDRGGAAMAWLLVAVLASVACTVAIVSLRAAVIVPEPLPTAHSGAVPLRRRAPWLVVFAYALLAAAVVPHALFWVDFLVRERGVSMTLASMQWWLVGLGSLIGPMLLGRLAGRVGATTALLCCHAGCAAGLLLAATSTGTGGQALSSLLVGALIPAAVSLTSVTLAEQVGGAGHARWWAAATLCFAGGQALGSALMSNWYAAVAAYGPLFLAGFLLAGSAAGLVRAARA